MTPRIANRASYANTTVLTLKPEVQVDHVRMLGIFGMGDFDEYPNDPSGEQGEAPEPDLRNPISYRRRAAWIDIAPRTTYTFSGKANTTQSFPLSAPIRARDWRTGVLVVRLHDSIDLTATAIVSVLVQSLALSSDEPSELFVGDTIASVQLTSADVAPGLFNAALAIPITPYVRATLQLQQGTTEATSHQSITLSVRIGGRRA